MKRRLHRGRRGTVLVVALVCLAVVMALVGHMLVGTLRVHRELRRERDLRQCELLLQAGLAHAAQQIEKDKTYTGETRNIAADESSRQGAARITIERIVPTVDKPGELRVRAEYPFGDEHSIRRSRIIPQPIQSSDNEE